MGLTAGCVLPAFDPTGKSCSALTACPAPFVCVLDGDAGTCTQDPCGNDARLGTGCDAGVGACLRTGVFICAAQPGTATATPVVCDAVPGLPRAEVCNGVDDDCDGVVDDHLTDDFPCELDVGVCAGKLHACIDGGYEPRCTALSYGSLYQSVETLCDGLDNDCDGRVDVSRAVPLPVSGDELDWSADATGLQVVFRQGAAVFWERLDPAFQPLAGPVQLSDAGPAYWPTVRTSGPLSLVAWVEEKPAGVQWLRIASVDGSGRLGWAGDAGALQTSLGTAQPPRIAMSADAGLAVAIWSAADGGFATQWLLPMDAGTPPAVTPFASQTGVGSLDVATGPGGPSSVFTAVVATAGNLLDLGWLTSTGGFMNAPPVYEAELVEFVDARAATNTSSFISIADGGARTLYWYTALPMSIGPATPQIVSTDAVAADVVLSSGGSFVAWQTADSGIRGTFFDVNGAVSSLVALPPGYVNPLLTWNGASSYVSLAAAADGGGFSAENLCAYDAGI